METTPVMLAFSPMRQPIDERNRGVSETIETNSASIVSLDYYRCSRNSALPVDDIFARVSELTTDWDGYGAHPPCEFSIQSARKLWRWLKTHYVLPLPDVMATPEGGVYLEWDTPNAVLVIELSPGNEVDEVDIYAKTPDFDIDGRLKDYGQEFFETLLAL